MGCRASPLRQLEAIGMDYINEGKQASTLLKQNARFRQKNATGAGEMFATDLRAVL
jgi:hypothetical protein